MLETMRYAPMNVTVGKNPIIHYTLPKALEKGEIVVIQGNGSLGLFALAYAKSFGCKVIMLGSTANAERLALTMKLNPDLFIDFRKSSDDDTVKAVKDFAAKENRGDGADVVIATRG